MAQLTASATGLERSQQLLAVYQQMVQSLTPQLPRDTRAEVRNCLATVQARVGALNTSDVDTSPASSADTSTVQPMHSRRYLGEISDVHFCNVVKLTAEPDAEAPDNTDVVDNYDPEELATPRHIPHPLMNMPGRAQVDEDLHTYFSTIHFAYPFVSKPSFMAKLETLQTEGVVSGLTPSWLSLLCQSHPPGRQRTCTIDNFQMRSSQLGHTTTRFSGGTHKRNTRTRACLNNLSSGLRMTC